MENCKEKSFKDIIEELHTSKDRIAIQGYFDRIAKVLFEDFLLRVNDSFYQLIDIEFYYYLPMIHPDVYTIKDPQQLECGKWFFHDWGIDLTFGNNNRELGKGAYGGILLKGIIKHSVSDLTEDKIYPGPLFVQDEITSKFNDAFTCTPNFFQIERVPAHVKKEVPFSKTKRKLRKVKTDDDGNFFEDKYRYIENEYFVSNKRKR